MPDQQWWRDLPRLQRGLYQRMLIDYAWGCTVPREQGAPVPEWSPWLAWSDMAKLFHCSPDQLRDDAEDAAKRGLIAVEQSRGRVRFQILWQRWPNLKDYVAPIPRLMKKERAEPSSRWLAGISVKPGGSYDFTVPELPADFRLQKISLRNTGESGEVVFAGGGPAEGGILVLETHSGEENGSIKSASSEEKQECTPGSGASGRVAKTDGDHLESGNRGARNPVSGHRNGKDGSGATNPAAGVPSDASLQECLQLLAKHGPVVTTAFVSWFRKLLTTSDKALEAIRAVSIANPQKSVQWILGMVPKCLDGSYKPAGEKKRSAREQLADEIWGGGKKSA